MIAFEVEVDGERVCTAGVGDGGVVSVILTWVRRTEGEAPGAEPGDGAAAEEQLTLDVGGYAHETDGADVFVKWLERTLRVGQTLRVTVVDAACVDPPTSRRRDDPDDVERLEREHYERLKRRYGDA